MEDSGLLTSAWKDLDPEEIGLKVMQVIALEAPGSERLKRVAVAVDKEALGEYGRAVEHFLFPPKSSGKHATGEPERSLSDKEPDTIGPPFYFHAGTGVETIQDCCVMAHRSGEDVIRTADGLWFSWSDAHWDHVKNAGTDVADTWEAWKNAFKICIKENHWTGWITVGTQVRVHGQMEPQELIASAYLFGHGQLPSESKQWQIARRVQKLLIQQLVDAHEEQIIRQSRAAAISQVLARTLSHNLGSHSLNAFSGESAMLGQFQEIECRVRHKVPLPGRVCKQGTDTSGIQDATDDDQLPPDKSCIDVFKEYRPCNPQEEAAISRQRREWLATYNNYLRERMDLLADITTAVPAFEMPKQLVADLLEGYSRNVLLATTIAGTGGRFRYCWQPAGLIGEGKDVNVAIPSDILGAHAFYLILENIVRNSAKHGGHSEEVVFTVSVTEPTEPEWKKKGLLCVQITESRTDLKKNTSLVRERNASINAPVLDDKTRRVRDKGWGTLEMKAACAYLRRIALEELDEKKYQAPVPTEKNEEKEAKKDPEGDEPPLLRAIGGFDETKQKGFGYEFYLMRPKLVMVCGAQNSEAEVIADAFPEEAKEADLQNHGIGAMTLGELQAITGGHRKQVVNHALLVFLADDEKGLKRFIHASLQDLAALPHEIVIVGCETCDAGAFQTLLTATKEDLKGEKNRKLSPASIDHNASILERSVVWVERSVWKKLSSQELEKLYMEVRHRWLVGWMNYKKYSLDVVPRAYQDYLCGRLKRELASNSILIEADYEAHDDLYIGVQASLGMQVADLDPKPDDLSPWLLAKREATNPRHVIIQRYPEALSPVMTLGWKRTDAVFNASIKQAVRQTWAQHHLACWTQGVAVVDERVQAVAENEIYQPAASEKNKDPKPIRVKDLLCMGGVFIPPGMELQRSDAFTKELWDQLVGTWLAPLHPMLGYVCIHLTILEKFSRSLDEKLEVLIDQIKSRLPGIRIIVVSGRGKPPELPRSELFMSYSALAQYTTQTYQRTPVLLNILAHSTRRIIPS